jgi:hypothetical protein
MAWGLFQWLPFVRTAALDPVFLPLPEADFKQYVQSDASGFGIEELPEILSQYKPTHVIGLLANCQALRYLAISDFSVECPNLNPSGENIDELTNLLNQNRENRSYVVLEDLIYVPATAPGKLITTIQRPGNGPSLSIYDLSPTT